jgi:hypothetical protein
VIDHDEDHPFLTSRHIDDLTEAVRALTRQITAGAQNHRESIDMQRRQLEVLVDIRTTAEMLAKVLMHANTNGAGS